MRPRPTARQRGAALLALLAVIALAASWFIVKQLNTESGAIAAARKNRNAEVLNKAKQALIGYIAAQAVKDGENNPGAMPCPENPGDFDSTIGRQGLVGTTCGTTTIGRFPWRTLGLDQLVDSSGESLWYVVGPGWGVATGSNTVINSNSPGMLRVDGVNNDAVALIIAPGPAFTVAADAAAGCNAWNQVRAPTGTPDWRNYLECENASSPADATFATTGPSGSFNDQVIKITVADILPAVEAAIASRIEREVAPLMKSVYSNPFPVTSPYYNPSWPAVVTVLPFAAAFVDPSTSAMKGVDLQVQGLLPLVYSETSPASGTPCTPDASAPRCDPAFVAWTAATLSGADIHSPSCAVTPTQINCTYYYACFLLGCSATDLPFTLTGTAANLGMAMRMLNAATAMTNVSAPGRNATGVLNLDGSATLTVTGTTTAPANGAFVSVLNALCGILAPLDLTNGCLQSSLSVPITLLADHPLLDSTSTGSGALGWFLRNKWHEVAYYALAPGFAPSSPAKSCTDNTDCLAVGYHRNAAGAVDAGKQRAIIILSGRSLTGTARPNGTLADWLEGANADGGSPFEVRSATLTSNRSFNDRVAVLDSNP